MYPMDIRQSAAWQAYLETLGWEAIRLPSGARASMMHDRLGNVIKVQRADLTPEDFAALEKIALENKIALVKVEPSLSQDLSVLGEAGYFHPATPLSPPSTIFLDLERPLEDLEGDLSASARYSIRRARREGAETEFFVGPAEDQVKKFYEIHASTGKQKGFYTQSYEDVQSKVELFGDKAILGFVKGASGEVTGANLYLGFENAVWYIHGGTTVAGRETKNGYELYWQSILFLKSQGYKWLDLEGVDDRRFPSFTKNWGGLSHFKEKFGGKRVEFPAPRVKFYKPILRKISKYFNVPV